MNVTGSAETWRALAHPVRRKIVELLAGGPKTTGDLAGAFAVTRFAVMKHLRQLELNGLIAVRRQGRERWNSLTVRQGVVLEIRPDASPSKAEPADVSIGASPAGSLLPFRVDQHVEIDASPGRVFDALTFNVSAWWGAPYLRSTSATNVVLEPQLGGRLLEEWGHRQGCIRGVVTAIHRDERLEIGGRIAGGGCLPAVLDIHLASTGRGTRLSLTHRGVVEPADVSPAALFEAAWADLVGRRLKAFAERGERAGIAERPPQPGAVAGWF